MGGKIRDTEDAFAGAAFRDERTKLLFAYDYKNRFTLRIWGATFKPAMERECRRLRVRIVDRVMVTALLTEGGKNGGRCVGAAGVHTRTGAFCVFFAKAMQNYCGEQKRDELLQSGVELLERYQREVVPRTCAANPHELMRLLEVFDILTVAQIILQACLARRQTCGKLEFYRTDGDGQASAPFLCIRQDGEKVVCREVPLDCAGNLKANYEKFNQDYIREKGEEARL